MQYLLYIHVFFLLDLIRAVTFEEEPVSLNASINQEVRFHCSPYNATYIQWLLCPCSRRTFDDCVSQSSLKQSGFVDVSTSNAFNPKLSNLTITIPENSTFVMKINDSCVVCFVLNEDSNNFAYSKNARLLIQGTHACK